jgi:dCTP deaminase
MVLCSTIEYIKLPEDIFITLSPRSSYSRLGFSLSTIIQPGYCGCVPLELTNTNNVPVKVLTGSKILQARFFQLPSGSNYFSKKRKYYCQVRPELSKALDDGDITILRDIANDL